MKTPVVEQFLGFSPSVEEVIGGTISSGNFEEPFYVFDVQDILKKHKTWLMRMPRIRPYYAVKCNSSPIVLELLASLGLGFDCASKGEIDSILALGVRPDNIIYANPCKTKSFVRHAASVGVDLMTFDNEPEIYKVAQNHPNAQLVLRIKVDDSHSVCRFSSKFGADVEKAAHLLSVAKSLNVNVVGVSFHVGSGCQSADSYIQAIANAKYVFELGQEIGFDMTLLDIGGGFPGTSNPNVSFEDIAKTVSAALDTYFPETDEMGNESRVSVIAEPGRYYVASAFTLATMIIAKREVTGDNGEKGMMYYLNDGVYGSFNCTIFDHWVVEPKPFLDEGALEGREALLTTLWGPTCDSMDLIKKDVVLPEMDIGEWMVFQEMGAYTIAAASTFNGFQLPSIKYHIPAHSLEAIRGLPCWPRLAEVLQIVDETVSKESFDDADHMDHHLEMEMEMIPVH